MRSVKFFFLSTALVFSLSGCDTTKQAFGMKRSSPNEFTVIKRAPLTIPSSFDLPEPEPGIKDRSERIRPASSEKAKSIVFQDDSKKISQRKDHLTKGDDEFLSKAGAQSVDDNIRKTVDRETYALEKNKVESDENWLRNAIGIKNKKDQKNVINPKEEAERLKSEKGNIVVRNPYDQKNSKSED